MESRSPVAAVMSPVSDGKIWNALRCRVDTILEERRPKFANTHRGHTEMLESDAGKRLREDSFLLMRGFDSVSSSLSQLTGILDSAAQNVRELAKPPSLSEILKDGIRAAKVYDEEEDREEPKPKRLREVSFYKSKSSSSPENKEAELDHGNLPGGNPEDGKQLKTDDGGDKKDVIVNYSSRNGVMENAKKLAVSMATKASCLARELKMIRSELCFMQDRCALLEEENRRLREEGFHDGLRSDDEDLVRLQLETLLAEKSRLASENANLKRENQCLQQLVEYHQLTSQELSESYDHIVRYGTCLDFSDEEAGNSDIDQDKKNISEKTLTSSSNGIQGNSEEEKMQ